MLTFLELFQVSIQAIITIVFFNYVFDDIKYKKNGIIIFIVYIISFIGISNLPFHFQIISIFLLNALFLSFHTLIKTSIQGAFLQISIYIVAHVIIDLFIRYYTPWTVLSFIGYSLTFNILMLSLYLCCFLWLKRNNFLLSAKQFSCVCLAFGMLISCIFIIRISLYNLTSDWVFLLFFSVLMFLIFICLLLRIILKNFNKQEDLIF